MLQIDKMSRQPIYEQIVEQIERQVLTGILKEGDRISSVRELSAELSINPNTIQKAYLELDRRGITFSSPGLGSFIAAGALIRLKEAEKARLSELAELITALKTAGVTKDEINSVIDEIFERSKDL